MICKISTLGTSSITVKGTHHPQVTKFDVLRKFSTCTNSCLSYLGNKIQKGLQEGNLTGMILIDLQKSCNTLPFSDKRVYVTIFSIFFYYIFDLL